MYGDVKLFRINLKELPYKFGRVNGWFDIGYNKNLISLKNCPNKVNKYFRCSGCSALESLEGCPKEVGRDFYCIGCKRRFTSEEVRSLCKVKIDIIN